MVDIYPFKALRPMREGDISAYICPPYDVISADERAALVKKSASNVVQVELPDGEGDERYRQAAALLEQWKDDDVIQQDRRPSVYLLETTYKISDPFAPAASLKRYGVLVALRLETPGKGAVRPHEKTLPKAKDERLKLLRATRTHVSPIFGLFFDKKKEWPKWVSSQIRKKPVATAREHSNLSHRLWKVDRAPDIRLLQRALKGKALYIADGHHRYEVAWAYKEEQLTANPGAGAASGWNYVMAYICPIEEPGLLMLPTHRLVHVERSFDEWKKHLETMFSITAVASAQQLTSMLSTPSPQERRLGWIHQEGVFLLTLKRQFSIQRCLPNRPDCLRALDVVLLHDLVLEEAAGKQYTKDKNLIYTRSLKEIKNAVQADHQWSAFILASSGVPSLADVAAAGEVMPPKTTYFYPKVPTGFALMAVGQKISNPQ